MVPISPSNLPTAKRRSEKAARLGESARLTYLLIIFFKTEDGIDQENTIDILFNIPWLRIGEPHD